MCAIKIFWPEFITHLSNRHSLPQSSVYIFVDDWSSLFRHTNQCGEYGWIGAKTQGVSQVFSEKSFWLSDRQREVERGGRWLILRCSFRAPLRFLLQFRVISRPQWISRIYKREISNKGSPNLIGSFVAPVYDFWCFIPNTQTHKSLCALRLDKIGSEKASIMGFLS